MTAAHIGLAVLLTSLTAQPAQQRLQGTATYPSGSALPGDAVFVATLQDVSRVDAPASVVAVARLAAPLSSPLTFTLEYDAARVVASHRYVVRADIRSGDRLLFTTDTAVPVITSGSSTTVSLALRVVEAMQTGGSAASSPQPPALLPGTAWTALSVYGTPVVPGGAPDNEPHLVFGTDNRIAGADGCNRLTGSYTQERNGITFGPIAGTQRACPASAEVATRFRAALRGTSHWSLVSGRLEFYGATGAPLVVFERRLASDPVAVLTGATWQLVKFTGGDDRVIVPDDGAKYTVAFADGGRVSARVDCNRGRATWRVSRPGALELGPLVLTRARCPEGSLHDQIVRQWPAIRSFLIRDGHLFLSLMADGGVYEFEPATAQQP